MKINNQVENHAQTTRKDEPENMVPTYDAPATLPNTGTQLGLPLIGLGVLVATFALSIKKKGKEDE
nr:MAG TPA: cell adhesion protein [Caudoviricetes sp.]